MALDPVIFRTPILDASGKLTREWIRFFQELQAATGTVQNVQNTTVMAGQASAFDDAPTRDVTAEITNALLTALCEPVTPAPANEPFVDWTPAAHRPADMLEALGFLNAHQCCTVDPLAAYVTDSSDPLGSAAAAVAAIPNASSTSTGLLTSNDWSTFNSKAGLALSNNFTVNQGFGGVPSPQAAVNVAQGSTVQVGANTDSFFTVLNSNSLRFNRAGGSFVDQLLVSGTIIFRTTTTTATDTTVLTLSNASATFAKPVIIPGNAPALSTSTGTAGQLAWDSGFLYLCIAANSWKRVALTTF